MKDFICEYKKGTNLGELYLLPIDRRLYDVPEKPVISNYSTPKENFSSHYAHLEVGWPYIRDTEEFLKRLQNIEKNPQDSILVTADVAGLHPNMLAWRLLKMRLIVSKAERYPLIRL